MNIETPQTEKVVVYCIENGKLLVFRHTDFSFEEVGIQVPAGSIREGESPANAAIRELREETGKNEFEILRELGTADYNMAPHRNEIQHRRFFLAKPTASFPDRWDSAEMHDGNQPPTNFECFWIPLERGHILQAGQGALLCSISENG